MKFIDTIWYFTFIYLKKNSGNDKDEGPESVKPTQMAQLDALLGRLTTLGNRDMIDNAAVEFCYMNSKAARKKLIKVKINK